MDGRTMRIRGEREKHGKKDRKGEREAGEGTNCKEPEKKEDHEEGRGRKDEVEKRKKLITRS